MRSWRACPSGRHAAAIAAMMTGLGGAWAGGPCDGDLGAPQRVAGTGGMSAVVIGDFNGDGAPDLAIGTCCGGGVTWGAAIMLGNPEGGGFGPPITMALPYLPSGMASGDFDGDGRRDLAASTHNDGNSGSVRVMLGAGDGTLLPAVTTAVGTYPTAPAVADFDGDGMDDLAVGGSSLSILLSNGDGTFRVTQLPLVGNVVTGDFNGDGIADLASFGAEGVTVLLGRGGAARGTFETRGIFPSTGVGKAAVGDFNGDGRMDLAGFVGGGRLVLMVGLGDGAFAAPLDMEIGLYVTQMAAADLDGDGLGDLVLARPYVIETYLGTSGGMLRPGARIFMPEDSLAVAAGDLSADGKPDVLMTSRGSRNAWLLRNHSCASDYNCDGIGDFSDYVDFLADFESGQERAEVNNDGFLDFFDYEEFVRVFERGC